MGKKQTADLLEPTLQNEAVSLPCLGGSGNVDGWDGFISSFCLVLDDQFLGMVHLFLAQPPAAAAGRELWGKWGSRRGSPGFRKTQRSSSTRLPWQELGKGTEGDGRPSF